MSISAGGNHTVALKQDGTLVAWVSNDNGQCNVSIGLADVVAITAGDTNSVD